MSGESANEHSARVAIIEAVKQPLQFLTLALLVIEVGLGISAGLVEGPDRTYLIIGMLVLLFLLIIVVAVLAIKNPTAIYPVSQKAESQSIDVKTEAPLNEKRLYSFGYDVNFEQARRINVEFSDDLLRYEWNRLDAQARQLLQNIIHEGGGIEEIFFDSEKIDFKAMNDLRAPVSFPRQFGLSSDQLMSLLRRLHNGRFLIKVETPEVSFYCVPKEIEQRLSNMESG